MRKIKIEKLIELAKEEVKNFGYSESSLHGYYKFYNMVLDYYQIKKIEFYSYNTTIEYLKFHLEVNSLENLTNSQKLKYRYVKVLDSVYKQETIPVWYHYKSEIVLQKENVNILESCINYYKKIDYSEEFLSHFYIHTKSFLVFLEKKNIKLKNLTYNDIISYIDTFPTNVITKNNYIYYLKKFLTFMFEIKIINTNLSIKIPNVKTVKNSKIPSVWKLEDVKQLLLSIDRNTRNGKRNYAIILLAMTTSMRGRDIINLKISNIDFNNNEIKFIQQKTKVELKLPLLSSTKVALLDYINNGRQKSTYDNVFLKDKVIKPISKTSTISSMVEDYAKKINLNDNQKRGIHSFRHTVLNSLFNDNETSIQTITEISGHINPNSLNSYIKTDYKRLSEFTLSEVDFND